MHARLGLSHKKREHLKNKVTFPWLNTHVIKVMIYVKNYWVLGLQLSLFHAVEQDLCEYLYNNLGRV